MNDSHWRDPFADDETARERERRRAEREAARRERSEGARAALGARVREGVAAQDGASQDGEAPPPAAVVQPQPPAPPPGRPPRPPRSDATIRRRRAIALVVVGALIALVAAAGVVLSRRGDGDAPAPQPVKERKTVSVTIPEGYDRSQVAGVAKDAGLEGDYERATRSSNAIDLGRYGAEDAESLEGFLFPATYEIYRGASVSALVRRQLEAFQENFAGLDMGWARSNGYSPYDVVIVASMIEREIAVPEERELAASVIYNRLDAGNPLGIDATIRFEDQNYDEPLVQSRLQTDTPYNTRTNAGLPPGPIGSPGLASLEAAADPADTDYFFYVIKPGTCNEHVFVETEEEFAAAEAEYQAALQAEGGSPTNC